MKIALLGAGHIGQTIARLLHATGDYQVTVIDRSAQALAHIVAHAAVTTSMLDSAPSSPTSNVTRCRSTS